MPEKLLWKQIDVITANIELFQKVNHRNKVQTCAAEAIFYCPTMNSHRPKS